MYKKILNYGVRRLFVRFFIYIFLYLKKFFYLYFFSDNNQKKITLKSFFQPVQFIGRGRVEVDPSCKIGVWPSPNLLSTNGYLEARNKHSFIKIGKKTFINNNITIIADRSSITIGDECLIGPNVCIFDSNFHGLEIENRLNGNYECAPVFIGDQVFIGANVTILKGVSVGDGAVIGNGSVVVKNIPPKTVFAGVPAKLIKEL
ncbi:acyltransferase [Acinetobacter johnsonii]|uniref:acyltransferase n=1 Tax=Acinetobacter johnsonii TaxID=40214 RepID=UPI001F46909D|nr:acyltransferase [Acinetobacter johnsonii]MCF7641619.1 acyltransferase [Acinetobacter johnsonii]